jgi:hypothetical protein
LQFFSAIETIPMWQILRSQEISAFLFYKQKAASVVTQMIWLVEVCSWPLRQNDGPSEGLLSVPHLPFTLLCFWESQEDSNFHGLFVFPEAVAMTQHFR